MTPATQTLPDLVPQDVLDFAVKEGVTDYLPAVLEMTRRVFSTITPRLQVEDDPEIANDRHIVILVEVKEKDINVPKAMELTARWNEGLFANCPAPLVYVFRLGLDWIP